MTLAPSPASRSASSRPMPRPAPVTTATLPSSSPMVMPPCVRRVVRAGSRREGNRPAGARWPALRPRSVADRPGQGQNRASASAVTSPMSATVSPRERSRPKRAVRLTTSRPGGGEASSERSDGAGDAEDGQRPTRPPPAQLEHAAGHLAPEGGRVEVALTGDGQVGPLEAAGQADQTGHEVEARLDAGPERQQPPGQPAGRARPGHGGHVDAGQFPVARRHLGRGAPSAGPPAPRWPPSGARTRWRRR